MYLCVITIKIDCNANHLKSVQCTGVQSFKTIVGEQLDEYFNVATWSCNI